MAEDKMENGYELWLKCCDNTKSGEVKRFLEVPYTLRLVLDLSRLQYFHSDMKWSCLND